MIKDELRLLVSTCADYAAHGVAIFIAAIGGHLLRKFRINSKELRSLRAQASTMGESMEKELAIGTEGKVDVKIQGGKIYLVGKYDGKDMDADLTVGIEVDLLIDKLAAKIPGQVDDAIFGVLKAALKVL